MLLTRHQSLASGIFGTLQTDTDQMFDTLEHAYPVADGYQPKLPPGTYTCQRGVHRLHDGIAFETFEILGVEGHHGILFHIGNFNSDSDGCVLLGLGTSANMLIHSRDAFRQFMQGLMGIDEFQLEVV